ncbi:hypothetical protein PCANC_26074 [Puccinia coronata f. sp. avenae]|uniref:Endonuclease III homolog n=1 Tax=Puccinia coronata f. sp. avenae TaxID=200324 RepID=A0A2N5S2C9_9BASI|nr:hypothetical protein PCANC_26074 [Puccinia coronata f. sp. avenae]PLW51392.1 hypothetical protein PCASD_00372 [Puccinia coronata f. sp. avenae]
MPPRTRLRTAAGQATNSVSTPAIKQSPSEVVSPVKRSQSSQALSPEKSPSKKKSKTIVKQALVEPVPPPPRWREAYALITEQRKTFIAPVDTMGCDKAGDMILEKIASGESINQESVEKMKERSERDRRLACLVSLMLSSQTKDEVTAQATLNLRLKLKNSLTVDSLREASLEEIESCINKVGFWKKKAQYIKLMADDLLIKHQSDVPKTLEELVALKGVGPKMAFLALSNAWSINLGIGVDTHVHRISNRLGWVQTLDPEATRINLESWLPKDLFQEINHLLVGFGQVICLPVGPKCEDCYVGRIAGLCPSSKAEANREKKLKSIKREKSTISTPSPKKVSTRSRRAPHIDIKLEYTDNAENSDQEEDTKPPPAAKTSRFFKDSRVNQDPTIKLEPQEEEEKGTGAEAGTNEKLIRTSHEMIHTSTELPASTMVSSPLTEIDDYLNPQLPSSHQTLAW